MPREKTSREQAIDDAAVEAAIEEMKDKGVKAQPEAVLKSIAEAGMEAKDVMGTEAFLADETQEDDDQLINVYHRGDGSRRTVLISMLSKMLKRRFNSSHIEVPEEMIGQKVFSLSPVVQPERETYVCDFHKDSEIRDEVDIAGISLHCPRTEIPSKAARLTHSEHRHPQEWRTVLFAREAKEKAEDREFQQKLLKRMVAEESK